MCDFKNDECYIEYMICETDGKKEYLIVLYMEFFPLETIIYNIN